jgi:2-iminobutanoate/2-iminopropanoate deaminase
MKTLGPYSKYVKRGGFIFVSGQLGIDEEGKICGDIEVQTRKAIENLLAAVEEAGGKIEGIAKVNVYLKDIADFNLMNKVYSEYFKKNPPARTTIGVSALPREALVELDAVAKV